MSKNAHAWDKDKKTPKNRPFQPSQWPAPEIRVLNPSQCDVQDGPSGLHACHDTIFHLAMTWYKNDQGIVHLTCKSLKKKRCLLLDFTNEAKISHRKYGPYAIIYNQIKCWKIATGDQNSLDGCTHCVSLKSDGSRDGIIETSGRWHKYWSIFRSSDRRSMNQMTLNCACRTLAELYMPPVFSNGRLLIRQRNLMPI